MSNLSYLSFTPLIKGQQEKSWQQFSEQYPDATLCLSSERLALFKKSIALSDFILRSALQSPNLVIELFESEQLLSTSTPNYCEMLTEQLSTCTTEEQLHQQLRLFRLVQMVHIAIGDFLLDISLDESLERLSSLADNLIIASRNWLNKLCQDKWGIPVDSDGEEQSLLVYGMGKLGGKELNFSSDIDLIFVYPEAGETQGVRRTIDNQTFFTRLGQKLITALNQQTADGFVYRVDMRLRPFGDSGPITIKIKGVNGSVTPC